MVRELQWAETTEGRLPAMQVEAGEVKQGIAVGDVVAIYSRGSMRAAIVEKVGRKRATVQYTTAGAVEAAADVAAVDRVAQVEARFAGEAKQSARYLRMAELIEELGIEVTEGKSSFAEKFIPVASLPAEYRALDGASGGNAAGTTIVYSPETLREWAQAGSEEKRAELMAAAEAEMAKSLKQRTIEATYVTSKAVPFGEVYEIAGS